MPLRRAALGEAFAIALGLLAQYLFVREVVGMNVVVLVAATLAAAWVMRRPDAHVHAGDAWLATGALAFAALCAVRVDAPLIAFDLAASTILTIGAVVSLRGVSLWHQPLPQLASVAATTLSRISGGGASVIGAGAPALVGTVRSRSARVSGYAGGLLLAVPFVIVFGALFSSADAVFRHLVETAFDLDALRRLFAEIPTRAAVAVVVMWAAAGIFAALATTPSATQRVIARVASVETAVTFVVVIDALFAVFVVLQVAYLFGGRDTIDAAGITYSAYGRSGFFELVAVASLVAVLLFVLDLVVRRRNVAYVVAACALVALSAVVLASAWLRMDLYQRAYVWSELRFYAFAGIAYVAVALLLLAHAVITGTMPVALQRLALAAGAVAIAANVIGPSDVVARHNIERVVDPAALPDDASRGLDLAYLLSLGDGAVATTVELLPSVPEPEASTIAEALRAATLRRASGYGWQSVNVDRERARLASVRAAGDGTAHIR